MKVVGQRKDDWSDEGEVLDVGPFSSRDAWEYENGYSYTSHYSRTAKTITHWEIYKRILDVPGDILELGVYKMGSFLRWAAFREIAENAYARKIIGFDSFGEFPSDGDLNDQEFAKDHDKQSTDKLGIDEAHKIMKFKGFRNYELIRGDVRDTLPIFLENNPHTRIGLLHLDMDVYTPTEISLELLWDRVVQNGILVVDDYASVEGASNAVDEFLQGKGKGYSIKKMKYHPTPSIIIKD